MARKLPKIITQEEFEIIFKHTDNLRKNAKDNKKKILKEIMLSMLLGFEAGMRISEIVGLKGKIQALQKNQIEENSIRIIQGKGKRDRVVPKPKRMNNRAIEMLPLSLNRRTLQRYITKVGEECLKKPISFHTLRHGFCSHLAGEGRPLHEIQMLAGHSRLDTTGIYLHANPKQAIKQAQDVF